MKLTRKVIHDIATDAITEVTDALSGWEEDEIADLVAEKLTEEFPELFDEEEETESE